MTEARVITVHEDLVIKLIQGFQGIIDYEAAAVGSIGLPVLDVFNAAANIAIQGAVKAGISHDGIERAFRGLLRKIIEEHEASKRGIVVTGAGG